jgi:hypothetical protein
LPSTASTLTSAATSLRTHFARAVGTPTMSYRSTFRRAN